MKFIVMISLFLGFISCGFHSEEGDGSGGGTKEIPIEKKIPVKDDGPIKEEDKKKDFDGDMVNNGDEIDQGRNPNVADLPDIRVRFIQNYKIKAEVVTLKNKGVTHIEIDTKTGEDDPDFKYRVGDIFIREEAYNDAASVGRFSTHTWGEIEEHDLTWVQYPKVDSAFYLKKKLELSDFVNSDKRVLESVSVELENSVKLKANTAFKSIKNLELNFYFYNYELESYELLKTAKIEKHFNAGVNETFTVKIENIPAKLLSENYLRKGEFIISEVADYEIPELKTTYKQLLKSIRAKSIPVVYNTPLKSKVEYVGLDGKTTKFNKVLSYLFDKKFKIVSDKLTKINQFEDNLPEFEYLDEVKELDKKGKWFVFTNKLLKHYLDHDYGPKDIISLSYITGHTLAKQSAEKISSFRKRANSGDSYKLYPLGNISKNSLVEIQLMPIKKTGTERFHDKQSIISDGKCGDNCYKPQYKCDLELSIFRPYNKPLTFKKNFEEELSRISLLVDSNEYSLKELVNKKLVIVKWIKGHLHITIKDFKKIVEDTVLDDAVISLKLSSVVNVHFHGLKLVEMAGRDYFQCPSVTVNVAGKNGFPISIESKDFSKWQHNVNWNMLKKGTRKHYFQGMEIGVASTINNYFN